jgi:hypothetical protein
MVADGMGAHAAGELASGIAVREVPTQYQRMTGRSPPLALRESFKRVNAEIFGRGEAEPAYHGMGTTCTALAILPRGAVVAHVGDREILTVNAALGAKDLPIDDQWPTMPDAPQPDDWNIRNLLRPDAFTDPAPQGDPGRIDFQLSVDGQIDGGGYLTADEHDGADEGDGAPAPTVRPRFRNVRH